MNIFTFPSLIHSYQTWPEKVASSRQKINFYRRSLVRFLPEVPPVFISLIVNVSFLLSNWLKMYKMRCIRQINKHYFNFLPYLIEISILAFWGFVLTEKMHNIDGNKRWHYITLNIHIIFMEFIREFKFGMIIHHYRFNSFVYSMTPYDIDRNLQGAKLYETPFYFNMHTLIYKFYKYFISKF